MSYNPFQYMVKCRRCKYRETSGGVVVGSGSYKSDIMVIGEAPGELEDVQGKPFVGRSGQLLFDTFAEYGLRREEAYITNIVKCRPPNNEDPKGFAVEACKDFLYKQIEIISPRIIVPVGRFSLNFFVKNEKISAANGNKYRWRNKVVMPLLHPAYILRNRGNHIEQEFRVAVRNIVLARESNHNSELFTTRRKDG